jgi:4-amino-4-deoxy-L-arabinose transferase-like glycosyltransferase
MMMIDRKTALTCAVLIALMLVAVVARIIFLPDRPIALALLLPLVCSTALRRHYRGKWKLEQSTTSGMNP